MATPFSPVVAGCWTGHNLRQTGHTFIKQWPHILTERLSSVWCQQHSRQQTFHTYNHLPSIKTKTIILTRLQTWFCSEFSKMWHFAMFILVYLSLWFKYCKYIVASLSKFSGNTVFNNLQLSINSICSRKG